MKETSKARLSHVASRFAARIQAADALDASDPIAFKEAFRRVRDAVIVPAMRDIGEELVKVSSVRYAIEIDDDEPSPHKESPSVTLRLVLSPRAPAGHRITFAVIDRDAKGPEILAFLEASPPPMDLARFQPKEIQEEVVEQLLVDSVEQIYACVAELPPLKAP